MGRQGDGALLALPFALAWLGTGAARERTGDDARDDARPDAADAVRAASPHAGDRLAVLAGDAVIAERLLTEAELAAEQVRIALRRIDAAVAAAPAAGASADAPADATTGLAAAATDVRQEATVPATGNPPAGEPAAPGDPAGSDAPSPPAVSGEPAAVPAAEAAADGAAGSGQDGLVWLVVALAGTAATIGAGHGRGQPQVPPPVPEPPDEPDVPASFSGQVIKGYVQGAAVYLDTDGDGQPDGEPVYTDAEGRFTFPVDGSGASIIAYGGVDTLTNVLLDDVVLRAPAGATVVTPLTTLVDEMMRLDSGLDATAATARLVAAFGLSLPAGADLLSYDPVAGTADGAAGIEDSAEAVLNTVSAIQSLLAGAGAATASDAAGAAITAMAQLLLQRQGSVALSGAADVRAVLETAFESSDVRVSSASDMDGLAAAIAAVNTALTQASGLDESSLQVTRYALSGFQDLLAQVGTHAQQDGAGFDLSFSSDPSLAAAIGRVAGGDVDQIIREQAATSIAQVERLEGGRFVFALTPELKFSQGAPDRIDTITVKFDLPGVVVQRESRAPGGGSVLEQLTPDAEGRYVLSYGELGRIHVLPPVQFNGVLGVEVGVHYVGLGVTETSVLGIPVTAVNDAPASGDSTVATLEDQPYVFRLADFPFSDPDDASQSGGGHALAAVRIASLPTAGALLLGDVPITAQDIAAGLFVSAADIAQGRLVFVPASEASGQSYASFGFQVRDDGGTAHGGVDLDPVVRTLTVDVAAVADEPAAPELDVEAATVATAEAGQFVVAGNAQAYATVAVTLAFAGGSPVASYSTTADGTGRFTVLVDAAAGGLGAVTVSATAADALGRTSLADTAALTVVAGPAGTPVEVDGFALGTPGLFDGLTLPGESSDYSITLIPAEQRAHYGQLLLVQNLSLDPAAPLYRIASLDDPGDGPRFVQVDALQFADGLVRLTAGGIIGGSTAGGGQVLHGDAGDDRISAGAGDDKLFGYDGDDVLLGNGGDDTLVSIGGSDLLIGGAGNDTLVVFADAASGGGSSATLHGGAGSDRFVIVPQTGFARDVSILDFVAGEDRIDLSAFRVQGGTGPRALTADDLSALIADLQDDGSAEIDLSGFVTAGGAALGGALMLTLAEGGRAPAAADFILAPTSGLPDLDVLLLQALHSAP